MLVAFFDLFVLEKKAGFLGLSPAATYFLFVF